MELYYEASKLNISFCVFLLLFIIHSSLFLSGAGGKARQAGARVVYRLGGGGERVVVWWWGGGGLCDGL